MSRFIRYFSWFVRVTLTTAVFLLAAFVVLLCITQVPLPAWVIDRIVERLSTPSAILSVQTASLGFKQGLALGDVQFRMNLTTNDLFVRADAIYMDMAIRPGKTWVEWIDGVRVIRPDASFEPGALPSTQGEAFGDLLSHIHITRVSIALEEPQFVGIKPEKVLADLAYKENMIYFDNCRAEWPGGEYVVGSFSMDPLATEVSLKLGGYASQQYIRPVLVLINDQTVLHYCDNITSPTIPLKIGCDISIMPQLETYKFNIIGQGLSWRGLPVDDVLCGISAENQVDRGIWRVVIDPLRGTTPAGNAEGTIIYNEEGDELHIVAKSAMLATNLFEMIEVLHTGELEHIEVRGIPELTIRGVVGDEWDSDVPSNLDGTIKTPDVTIYGLPLVDATAKMSIRDNLMVLFDQVDAGFKSGGRLGGNFKMDLTESLVSIPFETSAVFSNAYFNDLAAPFSRTNSWQGRMAGEVALSGNLVSNVIHSLKGGGKITLKDSVIARVPLFAGFTDFLARNVPGVETLVNQSDASLVFRMKNGIFHIDDFLLEGSFFSISGKGKYNMELDMLEATAMVNIFRRGSFAGLISRIITAPFDRLLMEFKVTGPLDDPAWNYRGIISRIVDGVSGSSVPVQQGEQKKKVITE